ncbi:unnamed protein product [Rhodiola kirilowii]
MERLKGRWWNNFVMELKKSSSIAAPMVAVSALQYLLQVVSVIIVGHVSQASLAAVAIATALTNVTGFSLLSGLCGAMETLCGQAYGAKQYQELGTYTYSAMMTLILVCCPISISWIFIDKLLILIGQDPLISSQARDFSLWLIPGLFGGAILKPMTRYVQTQSLILPMLASSFVVLCIHVPLCWALVFKLELGNIGAAIAFSFATWLNVALLGCYINFSPSCAQTRARFSTNAVLGIGEFFRLAVPSAVMVCLKWWSCEVLVLLAGLLPNAKLETSVLSICLTISTLHFTIAYGFGVAASTRVSNELGAGDPGSARVAAWTTMFMVAVEATIASTGIFISRHRLGNIFNNEKEVINYVATMAPLISLAIIMDGIQAVISGIAKGSGWQHLGAYVNLGAFYLVGLPVGLVLGFFAKLRGKGFWIGLVSGTVIQASLLFLITICTNWSKQASIEMERRMRARPTSASTG